MHFGQILTQVTLGDQRAEHIEENKNKLATVMAATGRITVTAQIDPSYSPGGVNEHLLIHSPPRVDQRESSLPRTASRSFQPFLQGSRM